MGVVLPSQSKRNASTESRSSLALSTHNDFEIFPFILALGFKNTKNSKIILELTKNSKKKIKLKFEINE